MLKRDFRKLDALHAMQQFLDRHSAELRGWDSGGARRHLDEVTAELGALALAQGVNAFRTKAERKQEAKLATALRHEYFKVLVKVGKLRKFSDTAIRHIPYPYRRTNTTALVVAARAAIKVAKPWSTRLGDQTGSPGFLDAFAAAADELEASTGKKGSTRGARTGATRTIEGRIKRATLVVAVADALVRAKLDPRSPLLAEWRVPVRAFRSAGRARAAGQAKG